VGISERVSHGLILVSYKSIGEVPIVWSKPKAFAKCGFNFNYDDEFGRYVEVKGYLVEGAYQIRYIFTLFYYKK
jgi:hypothetical protein